MMYFDDCEYESSNTNYIFLFSLIMLFSILIFKIYKLQTQVYDLEAKMDLLKIFVKSKFTEQIKVSFENRDQHKDDKENIKNEEVTNEKFEKKEDKKSLSEIFHDLKVQNEKKIIKEDKEKINDKNDDEKDKDFKEDIKDKDVNEEEEEKKEKVLKKRVKKSRI